MTRETTPVRSPSVADSTVKDDEQAVASTMESILAQTRRPDEIVVGDQHSADDTVARILAYERGGIPIRIVQARRVGAAGGRNAAIAAARHEIIAAADFGNVLDEAWLEEIVKPFEQDAAVDLAAGVALPERAANRFQRYASAVMYPAGQPEAHQGTWFRTPALAGGASMAFRKQTWRRAGGFPEWLRTAEDKLFSRRVHRFGGTVGRGARGHRLQGAALDTDDPSCVSNTDTDEATRNPDRFPATRGGCSCSTWGAACCYWREPSPPGPGWS